MKKLFKKFSITILVFAFVIQPVLQVVLGLGNVQAVPDGPLITYSDKDVYIKSLLASNQTATFVRTERKYKVHYRKTFAINVFEGDFGALRAGTGIQTNRSGFSVTIKKFEKTSETPVEKKLMTRNGFTWIEKKYKCSVQLEGYLETDYQSSATFPTITASYSGSNISFRQQLSQMDYEIVGTRYVYNVQSSKSSNFITKKLSEAEMIALAADASKKIITSTVNTSEKLKDLVQSGKDKSGTGNGTENTGKTPTSTAGTKENNNNTKTTKEITMNKNLCDAVYSYLKNNGHEITRKSDTVIIMDEQKIKNVKTIDISGKEITDLTGIANFSNLETLIAQNNKLSNLSDLGKLTSLKKLNLNNNSLKNNISPILNLTNLEELHLENNGITYSGISGNINKLTKLKKLYLNKNSIDSLASILAISDLQELYINENNIKNVTNIDSSKLQTISMKNNNASVNFVGNEMNLSIANILQFAKTENSKLYTSENFECENCKIENGKIIFNNNAKVATVKIKGGVADGTKITIYNRGEALTFDDKALADKIQKVLGNIILGRFDENGKYYLYISRERLYSIQNLDLSATDDEEKITDITGIESFINLKSLNLRNNKVGNLDKLAGLNKLETLDVRFNELTNLNSLQGVTNLLQLDASNNMITDISGISSLTNLKTVILSNNNIGDNLKPLDSLKNLSILAISNNNISSINDISSLNLSALYASNNKLISVSGLNQNDIDKIDISSNDVVITINGTQTEIPDVIKNAISENGGTSNLELTNCTINNNKIILNDANKIAQIKINKGNSSDTIVTIQPAKDVTPPEVTVEYNTIDSRRVEVTIKSNEEIPDDCVYRFSKYNTHNLIFHREDEKTISATFYNNVSNFNVIVTDMSGNETVVPINVGGIQNIAVPDLTVEYSNTSPTNESVVVKISSSKKLNDSNNHIQDAGWTSTNDGKTFTKTFTQNGEERLNIWTEDGYGNYPPVSISVVVSNIDKELPITTVEYSTEEKTKGSIRATIWSDEEIDLVTDAGSLASKITKLDENGNTKYGISLYYAENKTENINVKDLAGNETQVKISVKNIDKGVDGLGVKTTAVEATNKNQTLTVSANENVQVTNGKGAITAVLKQVRMLAEKAYYENKIRIGAYKLAATNDLILIAENNSDNDDSLNYELSEPALGVIEASDVANNVDVTLINTNYIDKQAPIISRSSDVVNEDGTITVTLVADEELQNSDDLADWVLGSDRKSLTKTFEKNKTETVIIKDLAGNSTEFLVDVKNVEGLEYTVYTEEVEGTEQCLVLIKANRELKEIDGWTLLESKNEIAKLFDKDGKENVVIEDLDGNTAQITVQLTGDTNYNQDEENKTTDENNNNIDDTQATKNFPQTGGYILFEIILSAVLVVLTAVTLINYKKNSNI